MVEFEPHFSIDEWADSRRSSIIKVHAKTESLAAGRGAFHACVVEWPAKVFTLRNGAMVLAEHPPRKREDG